MRWKKRIELILLEFTNHQIRLFWRNWEGHLVWSPNIRAPLRRIWWVITGKHEKHMHSFINWKKKETDHWLRRYGFDPEKDQDIYLKAVYDENGRVRYYEYNMEEFIKRGYKPKPSELRNTEERNAVQLLFEQKVRDAGYCGINFEKADTEEPDTVHAPWDRERKDKYFDTRNMVIFMNKGMDKCQNLNCLGKLEHGMKFCPHCGVRLRWFDEPAPKGWT
jgi:hypothetical protein